MRKLAFCFGVLVLSACVSETPMPMGVQGEINGPCFSNNTCNPGLICQLVKSVGTCVADPDASVSGDSAPGDSGPRICSFQPTSFPCGPVNMMAPIACFDQASSCTATGCNGVAWSCFSPNQCSSAPCCVTAANAVLVPNTNCLQGALQMLSAEAGGGNGAECGQGIACNMGDTQLCQANAQCPPGKICSPVKITGAVPGSMMNFFLGACMPQ